MYKVIPLRTDSFLVCARGAPTTTECRNDQATDIGEVSVREGGAICPGVSFKRMSFFQATSSLAQVARKALSTDWPEQPDSDSAADHAARYRPRNAPKNSFIGLF